MTKQYRPSIFISANRDDNESKFTELLKAFHVDYFLLSPGSGSDILVEIAPMEFWEIKNPEQKWKLTDAEKKRQAYCQEHGIPYRVLEYTDQAAEILSQHFMKERKTR